MDTLIAIGATTAYVFSLVIFIARLAGSSTGSIGGQPLYFGETAALLAIISLGHWLEARATARAWRGQLADLRAQGYGRLARVGPSHGRRGRTTRDQHR